MIYAQIMRGGKMHLTCEPGEEVPKTGEVIRKGYLSAPLCRTPRFDGYRMTCNVPLGRLCRNCRRVYAALSPPHPSGKDS